MRFGVRVVVIFILLISFHGVYYYYSSYKTDPDQVSSLHFQIRLMRTAFGEEKKSSNECCSRRISENRYFRQNIMFLKTHKCGSSSVQNILMRFGLKHNLNFALPKKGNYLGYFENISGAQLIPTTEAQNAKYNLLVHHTRYSEDLKKIMYNDTTSVTILREPWSQFESQFHYYKFGKKYGKNFREFLASLPLDDEFSTMYKQFDANASLQHRIHDRNQMSLDLGLPRNSFQNITAIRQFISRIDREFEFVMITEYMEASLIMLASLMGWPLHYVAFIPINSRSNDKRYTMTNADRVKLSHFNYADLLLYRHFLEKFKDCVYRYGVNSLLQDIATLTRMNDQLRQRCVIQEQYKGYGKTISYKLKNNDWICTHSTKSELDFTQELRDEQVKRLKVLNYTNL